MAVTNDDVLWCYRSLLGREPESTAVVEQQIGRARDFRQLVVTFLGSQEYNRNRPHTPVVPLERPDMPVESVASPAQLALLKDRIREAWTHLGTVRPYYSVLSGKRFLPQFIDDSAIDVFYATGVKEAEQIANILKRFQFADPASKTCVEYGCGLGRVTLGLAKYFRQVHGYDISTTHLAAAKQRAADSAIVNVDFQLCSVDSDRQQLEPCDFFYSKIVFQHNPPPIIRELITASLQALRAGGIAIFQVPTYGKGYGFRTDAYLARPRQLDMEMHCLPQADVFALIAELDCKLLEVREDGSIGRVGEWISNTFVVQRPA
jgi:SAM-dependent methyltransferase